MIHKFISGKSPQKNMVLFHGTGGTEEDLIPLAQMIDPDANILSVRGNVSENGMNRFFRRLEEGVLDEEDIRIRAAEIKNFLSDAAETYQIDLQSLTALGYSNGANIIAAMHYLYGDIFSRSILFHPMVPLKGIDPENLAQTDIFIGAGINDPMVPFEDTKKLEESLTNGGASVLLRTYSDGHSLTREEVADAASWYQK